MVDNPMEVNALNPLQVPIHKDVLIAVVEDVLEAIARARRPEKETAADKLEIDLLIRQRVEFLKWVQAQPGPNIDMAMYPVNFDMAEITWTDQLLH